MFSGGTGVDLPDIPLFVAALLGQGSEIDACVADVNVDGTLDGQDVQPFVDALVQP